MPAEHGAWGLVLEPLSLATLVAPSAASAVLAAAVVLAFLARQPARIALGDLLKSRFHPRTRWAALFLLTFLMGAGSLAFVAVRLSRGPLLLPLGIAALLLLSQLAYDARNRGRAIAAEVLGTSGAGALAAAIACSSGWPWSRAFALCAVMVSRSLPAVLFVRARLRLDRGLEAHPRRALAAHLLALLAMAALGAAGLVPWFVTPVFVLLLLRAVHGLSRFRLGTRPQTVGLAEVGVGVAFVALVAVAYRSS